MAVSVEITLFGGLHIEKNGQPVRGFVSSKAPALLAYLAVMGHPCRREALAGLLWGEMSEKRARSNLRQALASLRKRLGEGLLSVTRETVAWRAAAPAAVDVLRFSRCVQTPDSLDALQEAAALYRGDFLEGFSLRSAPAFEEWLLARRARYREQALYTLHTLAEHYLRQRAFARVLDFAARALALDPWREEAYRQLMLAMAYNGQWSAALKQYRACREVLQRELGVPPSAATAALYERIRAARGRRIAVPSPPGAVLGREREAAFIRDWVVSTGAPLLTITGPGGCGKTHLALHVLAQEGRFFLEGAWFVPLEAASADASLAAAIGQAMRFPFSGGQPPEKQLLAHLRTGERLFVLDNMEHILGEDTLSFVAALLHSAPQVKIVCTSRERLGLRREQVLPLGGLPCPQAEDDPERILRTPAAQLFLQCARRSQPTFEIRGQETALARLCRLLGGLPLALELAAAWTPALSVADIARRITRDADFLSAGWRDAPARHRSLRAVFEHSWRLLAPEEQAVYARLSVFRGGFTLPAAQQVAQAAPETLASLARRSLLRCEGERYALHPLLRRFAAEKLAGQREAACRHAHYFGAWLHRWEPVLLGGEVSKALRRIRPELDNLRLAWATALRQRDTRIINEMADSVMQIFDLSGMYREALEMAHQAVLALAGCVDASRRGHGIALGRAYGLRAAFGFRVGEYLQAREDSNRALKTLSPFRPHIAYGHALVYKGAASYGLGELEQAVACWREAVQAYREAGSAWGECAALSNLAEVMVSLEDGRAAEAYAAQGRALAQRMGNAELAGVNCQILAVAALQSGNLPQAASLAAQAVTLHRQVQHQAHIANALAIRARVAVAQEDAPTMLACMREALDILRRLGNPLYLEGRLMELAQFAQVLRLPEVARMALTEILESDLFADRDALRRDARALLAALPSGKPG